MQEYNSKHVPQLFIDIAQAMGLEDSGEDAGKAVKLVLSRIRCVTLPDEPHSYQSS